MFFKISLVFLWDYRRHFSKDYWRSCRVSIGILSGGEKEDALFLPGFDQDSVCLSVSIWWVLFSRILIVALMTRIGRGNIESDLMPGREEWGREGGRGERNSAGILFEEIPPLLYPCVCVSQQTKFLCKRLMEKWKWLYMGTFSLGRPWRIVSFLDSFSLFLSLSLSLSLCWVSRTPEPEDEAETETEEEEEGI